MAKDIVPVQLSGSTPTTVTLQDGATAAANGTAYNPDVDTNLTFEILGTAGSWTAVFEMAGPSGTYVAQECIHISDYTTASTAGGTTTPDSWRVFIPGGYTFRCRLSAVTTGPVDVAGLAVVA